MKSPNLKKGIKYLRLLWLGELDDFRLLELNWVFAEPLIKLVLIEPHLPS
jgi:hypothetical protein